LDSAKDQFLNHERYDLSINNLLEKNQMIEKQILEHSDEILFDLFSEWRFRRQRVGEYLADMALCAITKKYNSYILANPVNPISYAHFIRSDTQSKAFTIRSRVARTGVRNGFLESGSAMKPLDFWIQDQRFFAVERDGKECLVKEVIPSDRSLTVSCYEDGLFIVSDIDLVSIFAYEKSDEILFDPIYGELTVQELIMIRDVNQIFQKLVSDYCLFGASTSFKLIAHGAANRFSHSKASHLHYPMKIYTPDASCEILDGEFFNFNEKMRTMGYHTHLNPEWGF
jgi:hypothetical protein